MHRFLHRLGLKPAQKTLIPSVFWGSKITRPGLEPGKSEPKSDVLPLHHRVTVDFTDFRVTISEGQAESSLSSRGGIQIEITVVQTEQPSAIADCGWLVPCD